jgi:ubiquinol-cytochrome c reductase cytochrome b subunit
VTLVEGAEEWQKLTPEELAGVGFYRKEDCASCHAGAKKIGPDLVQANKRSAAWLIAHFKNPGEMIPGSQMPAVQLTDAQLNSLAAFLLKLTPANAAALESAPAFAGEGAMIYQHHKCGACHQVNGAGVKMGPALNGLAQRRSREWVEEHFVSPQKLSPGTVMPPYKFSSRDMDRITSYIMAIP